MAEARKSQQRKRPSARSPEARESQLISAAVDLAEKQIRDGTASAAVLTHYLKLATKRESAELRRIEMQIELDEARRDAMGSQAHAEELYGNAMAAFTSYRPGGEDEEVQ